MKSPLLNVLLCMCLQCFVLNQTFATHVTGTITDNNTNEVIPYVNIWVDGTGIGTISNIDGTFALNVKQNATIKFSSIGYLTASKEVVVTKPEIEWNISLVPDMRNLSEIEVNPDFSYDEELFRKVLDQKKTNSANVKSIDHYGNLDRTTIMMASNEKSKFQKVLKNAKEAFIYDKKKQQTYIPVYIAESVNDINLEEDEIEVVASSKDGIFPNLNEQIENMILEKIAIEFNFYKNQVTVLDRNFKSPLSQSALASYNIYLTDSTMVDNTKHYQFSFYPKNEHSVVFSGNLWVEDETFALIKINATLPPKANINFINEMDVEINYEKLPTGKWFYKNQLMNVKFSLGKNTTIDVQDSQSNIVEEAGGFQVNRSIEYIVPKDSSNCIENLQAIDATQMHYTQHEQKVKEGIVLLKENPVVKNVDKVGNMFLSGYYDMNKIEIGPIFDLYSRNIVEGHRFTLPFRTSEAFCKNFTMGGYLGYGTKSKKFKHGVSASYMLPIERRTIISAKYANDYFLATRDKYTQFIQENPYSKGNGNFISSLTSTTFNPYAFRKQTMELNIETDLSKNIGLSVSPYYHQNFEGPSVKFNSDGTNYPTFNNYGALVNFRFSFDRTFEEVYFARVYYGNTYPVINLSFDVGQIQVPNPNINNNLYALVHTSVKHRFNLGAAYVRYMLNAGYMIGSVPYTMLETPFGTQSLGYSRYSFNLLNYASFAHNLYANCHINLNGGGTLLKHIPLISELNLREIVSLKCHYGQRTSALESPFEIPQEFNNKLTAPYAELGVGITNIFKALRIEYVHLLGNYQNQSKYASRHGIRARLEVCF